MRVAEDELVGDAIADVRYIEIVAWSIARWTREIPFLFGAHLGIENDMQKHVAQFFADLVHVMLRDSSGQFKSLFYGILAQAVESLFAVPRAFDPQLVHDVQQPFERL